MNVDKKFFCLNLNKSVLLRPKQSAAKTIKLLKNKGEKSIVEEIRDCLICYLQADIRGYQGAVHLIKALHCCCPDLHLRLQSPLLCIGLLQNHMAQGTFTLIHTWTKWSFIDSLMVLRSSLPWFPAKASALIVAFLQTVRTSALWPSPKRLSPVCRYTKCTDITYTTSHAAPHRRDAIMTRCWSVLVPTHLFDVFHLILKVIDCPLTRHYLLLSVRAHPLHNAIHFGPMMLQWGLWHPIGHVSEVLRETGSHWSGFCGQLHRGCLILSFLTFCLCDYVLASVHTCTFFEHITSAWVQTPAYLHLIRYFRQRCCWALETGVWEQASKKKWGRVYWGCHISATQYMSCCHYCQLSLSRQAASEKRCTPAEKLST